MEVVKESEIFIHEEGDVEPEVTLPTLEEVGIVFEQGMKLDEFMERNKKLNIKWHIGSGSAFFLIGDYKHYKDRILEISCDYLAKSKKYIKVHTGQLVALESRIPDYKEMIQKIFNGNDEYNKNMERIIEMFDRLDGKIHHNMSLIERHVQYGKYFTPLTDRIVVDVYSRALGDGKRFNIIIDGSENGMYWDEEEYNKEKKA